MPTKFEEVGRVSKVSDTTDIVVSKLLKDGTLVGYVINKYVETEEFKGYPRGGVTIPDDRLSELIEILETL